MLESEDNAASDHLQVTYQNAANFLILLVLFGLSPSLFRHQASVILSGLNRQLTEQKRDAVEGAGDFRVLEAGKPIRRELAEGQQHTYRIGLSADQFISVIVEQQGIDLLVGLSGPDGDQGLEFDSKSGLEGQESVSAVAEKAGEYRLTVRPKRKGVPAGNYEIRIEGLRAATDDDRALQEARKRYRDFFQLFREGKYGEALTTIERAVEIREKLLGPEHRETVNALHNLATICFHTGDYARAESLHRRVLSIREKLLGPEDVEVATSLNNLSLVYLETEQYSKAEPLIHRALAIKEKVLGPEHLSLASTLINLGIINQKRGDYASAEPFYQRALAIRKKELGEENPEVAAVLDNLGLLYSELGDYAKAAPLHQKALAIFEAALGAEHPEVAIAVTNLALCYRDLGELNKAEQLHQRALAINEKLQGPEDISIAQSFYNLGEIYSERGEYTKAEQICRRALAIAVKAVGPEGIDVARIHDALGFLYRNLGDDAKAESSFHRALTIWEKTLGTNHPYLVSPLNNLAMLHAAKNEMEQVISFQSRANAVTEHNLRLNLSSGSERQKLAYLATLTNQADRTISWYFHNPNNQQAGDLAATIILQRKGRALDAASNNLNALRGRFNTEDQALLDRLSETRSGIARLVLGGFQETSSDQYRVRIKALEDQAETYEAEIGRRNSEFRAQSLPVTLAAVQSSIPANAALIEFATYRPFNAKTAKYGQPRYLACVLRREGGANWKEIGELKIVDKAIAALREALRDPKRSDVKNLARAVDKRVFQPLRTLVAEANQLLISPDGNLNLIPFGALMDEQGRYLVERYSISYLTSGRDLLRLQVARDSQSGPLVMAAPDFGGRTQILAARLRKQTNGARQESVASTFSRLYFPPLPYTAQEGEAVRASLPGATLLTKREANKAALLQMRSPMLLHIATHGFFLEDLKLAPVGERGFQIVGDDPQRSLRGTEGGSIRIENPLLRSGLVLAGANEHKPDDNGILTALEVTGLNLWGTKLVVLSACDTGVGEVKNGDGVHGLRRALVLAGSETQVMSLWAVSDKGTRDLMVPYYRLLQKGLGRGEALRQVQLETLKNVSRRHPYYWASFIQSGEWAKLEDQQTR
jgi:CHAT domain-containing protein/tetratricopeptide (TPR) repeat protein